jgi:hypothetical protein
VSDPRLDLGPQLTGSDGARCQDALDSVRPIIRLAPHLPTGPAGAAAALAHLLGRLHPHLVVDGDATLGPNPWGAATVAEAAAGVPTPEATRSAAYDLVMGIGAVSDAKLWVGGDDWTCAVSDAAVDARGAGGLGVHAGAALAAAEVLKRALGPLGLIAASALPSTCWNLLDHRNRPAPDLDTAAGTHVPPVALLGAGSVGSSIAALLGLTGPGGPIIVVDPDIFDPSRNPYRYPASTVQTDGPKAAWAGTTLRSCGWDAEIWEAAVATWCAARSEVRFDGVAISSVDRVDARADVADVLARTTLSLGVSGLAFHVQREHPDDTAACPYCQYLSVGTPMSQLAVYAEQTGIPMDRVAELLAGGRLEQRDVEAAVAAGRIHANRSLEMVGRRFEDLVRRAYAQASVKTVAGDVVSVSAPSVSWLAGTIAAAEVRKLQKRLPLLDRRVDIDLSGVPTGVVRTVPRDRSGRCLCANPFRIRVARRLYRGEGR